MRSVVVDANVLVSFFVDRHAKQRDDADTLLQQAEAGEVSAIVPQFVIFEVAYVLQSLYGYSGERLASLIRGIIVFPGVKLIDYCPWKRVMDLWPSPFPSIADAAIVALAANNRYDAVATFDQKLSKRLKDFNVPAYW